MSVWRNFIHFVEVQEFTFVIILWVNITFLILGTSWGAEIRWQPRMGMLIQIALK